MNRNSKMLGGIGLLIMILFNITACNGSKGNLDYTVYLNKLDQSNFNAYIFMENVNNIGEDLLVVHADQKKAKTIEDSYFSTCFNVIERDVLNRIKNAGDISDEELESYGQAFLFDKNNKYEVVIFENGQGAWKLIVWSKESSDIRIKDLKKNTFDTLDQYTLLESMQLEDNILYLYTNNDENVTVIKVALNDLEEVFSFKIPQKIFENEAFTMRFSNIFIKGDNAYFWEHGFGRHETLEEYEKDIGESSIYLYNFKTEEVKNHRTEGIVRRLIHTDEGIMGIRTEKNKIFLEKYDFEFNNYKTSEIKIDIKNSNYYLGDLDKYFYYENGYWYGTLCDDGKRSINYILIIDTVKEEPAFISKISRTKNEYGKIYAWFYDAEMKNIFNMY